MIVAMSIPALLDKAPLNTVKRQDEQLSLSVYPLDNAAIELKTNYHFYAQFGLWIIFLFIFVLGVWAAFAPLSSAVIATGIVVSETATKEVQHLNGGVVENIYIKEGDLVRKGQSLLQINDVQERTQFKIIESQYFDGLAKFERLNALITGQKYCLFSFQLLSLIHHAEHKKLLASQLLLFNAIKMTHHKNIELLKQAKKNILIQLQGLKKSLKAQQSKIKSYALEIKERKLLVKQKLDSNIRLREIQRKKFEFEADYATAEAKKLELALDINELDNQIVLEHSSYMKQLLTELEEVRAKKSDLKSSMVGLQDKINRALIVSPESGAVVGLTIDTIGSVIKSGITICKIEPQIKKFAVKAKVKTVDIDKIQIGQSVEVRFSSFDTRFTHAISGNLVRISANVLAESKNDEFYYEARVLLDKQGLDVISKNGFVIVPGMPADSMIKTGKRTFLNYLLKPFADMLASAFNED